MKEEKEKKLSKAEEQHLKTIAYAGLLSLPLTLSYDISRDVFWTLVFGYLFGSILLISRKIKHKSLAIFISIFVLLHFLIFPYSYVFMLHSNPSSFLIKDVIVNNEKEDAISEIIEEYNPERLSTYSLIIDEVINTKNSGLDSLLSFIYDKNILFIDDFLIYRSSIRSKNGPPMGDAWSIAICDNHGNFVYEFGVHKFKSDYSLKKILSIQKDRLNSKLSKFSNRKSSFENHQIWNYSRILWYSINIFDSKIITPNTRGANIVFFFHRFLIYFLLVFIGTNTYNAITKKKIE
ncbi:MAG: hypothetical protein GY834_04735 [Bacteroidetes bacterium]|nr:hypothetical protein [Bacteroidota bacterium]